MKWLVRLSCGIDYLQCLHLTTANLHCKVWVGVSDIRNVTLQPELEQVTRILPMTLLINGDGRIVGLGLWQVGQG